MDCTKGCQPVKVSQSHKAVRSSDWSLQLDSMKLESLVIVDQNATVNTFPGLVHTRPSHHESWLYQKSLGKPLLDAGAEGMADDWGEVETR